MKKMYKVFILMTIFIISVSCSKNINTNNDTEIEELKKQISNLEEQINNKNQQETYNEIQNELNKSNQQIENISQTQKAQEETNLNNDNKQNQINIEQAKQIATNNAGCDIKNVFFTKIIQDYDNAILKYEIEFISNNVKYEYEINGYDGTIIKYKNEMISYQNNKIFPNNNSNQIINIEKAKTISTLHSNLKNEEVIFTKQKYDFDDGIAKWEIEFISNNMKYEYEINGYDGTVIKYKIKSIYND